MTTDLNDIPNSLHLCEALGVVGITGDADGFKEIPSSRNPPSRRGSWETLAGEAEWCSVSAGRSRFVDVWLPRDVAEPLAGTRVRHGKITVRGPGRPCEVSMNIGDGRLSIHRTCGRIAVGEDRQWNSGDPIPMCKRHLSAKERERANDAEWREEVAAAANQLQREREAERAAREALERDADLLEDLGLAGLETDGTGHVTLTVEQLIGLIRQVR